TERNGRFPLLKIVQRDPSVGAAPQGPVAIGREAQAQGGTNTRPFHRRTIVFEVPAAQGPGGTAGDNFLVPGRDEDLQDGLLEATQSPQFLARLDVPDADGFVLAAGDYLGAVRREGEGPRCPRVSLKAAQQAGVGESEAEQDAARGGDEDRRRQQPRQRSPQHTRQDERPQGAKNRPQRGQVGQSLGKLAQDQGSGGHCLAKGGADQGTGQRPSEVAARDP